MMMRYSATLLLLLLLTSEGECWRRRRRSPPPPPPPDTTPPTLHGCPGSLGNQYTTTSTAQVSWSEPTCSDSGSSCTVTRTSGAAPGSHFTEGSHTISYRAIDTSGNTRSCSFSFTVVVIRCSTLNPPSNGGVSCTNGRSVGSVCYSSCNTGYKVSGSTSRTCVRSGNSASWSGSSVSCSRITCSPVLSSPSNGQIQCTDSVYFNSVCSTTCHSGYTLTSGSSQRTCTSTGWSGSTPQCQDVTPPTFVNCPTSQTVYPPDLETTAVVQWTEPSVSDTTGQPVSPTRTSGPASGSTFTEGVTPIKYEATDNAGNRATACEFTISVEVIRCSTISGDHELLVSCPDGDIRGSVCTFTCITGYGLVGSQASECQLVGSSGSWSHPTPSCQLLHCHGINAPQNGAVVGTCSTGYGSTCHFDCDEGYIINNDKIKCTVQPGSTAVYWEGSLPYCSIINCTKPSLTDGLLLPASPACPDTSLVPYGSQCSFACGRGYYMQGDQVLSCQSDGFWSHNAPSCHVLNCTSTDMPAPANGIKTGCSNAEEVFGTVCTISCNTGYLPDTPVYRMCDDDGTGSGVWDDEPVTCTIVTCPALPNPNNGNVTQCTYEGDISNVNSVQKYSTVCSLNCFIGFTRTSGSALRACSASGTWDGVETVCEDITAPVLTCPVDREIVAESSTVNGIVPWHEWEPLMATDAGAEIAAHLARIDSIPVSVHPTSLVEGAHHLAYDVSDPSGNGETCSFDVTIRVIRCPGLPVPDRGSVNLSSGDGDCIGGAVYGSTCAFGCDTGYQLSTGGGTFSRNCLRISESDLIGYWNAHQPSCLIKNCTVPDVINGYSSDCPDRTVGYGTDCEFKCNRGYTSPSTVNSANRGCQADTSWSGEEFNCSVVITCPAQLSLDFGQVIPPECSAQTEVRFDTECEYSCGSGFLLHGPSNILCNPDGSWNDQRTPYCEDIQNPVFTETCPVNLPVDAERGTTHANVTVVPPGAQDNSGTVDVSRIGSSETIFDEGSTSVSFLATDATGNEARCDVIVSVKVYRCPVPTPPVDGSVKNCSDLFYGSKCTFVCDVGHELIGSDTLTCELTQGMAGTSAIWDKQLPTCQIRTCHGIRVPPPAIKSGCYNDPPLTEDYGTTCSFTCPYGYQGLGEDVTSCDENGQWTSTNFSCERTPCPPLDLEPGIDVTPSSCASVPRFGDTCTLHCSRSGFQIYPQDSASVTCSGNGRWTKNIISTTCKDVQSPVFTQCPEDFIVHPGRSSTTAFVSWTVAASDNDFVGPSVSCDHPSNVSMPVGQHHVTCVASDRSGNIEHCSFVVNVEVLRCEALVPPLNGLLEDSCDTEYGSSCHVTCNPGYHLNGSSSASCEYNGSVTYWMWATEPQCEANWCPSVALPAAMVEVYPEACSQDSRVAIATVCAFFCTSGLSLVGNFSTVTCLIDGRWDREVEVGSMTCQDELSPVITSCPELVRVNRTEFWGVEVTFDLPSAQDNVDPHLEVMTDPLELGSPINVTVDSVFRYTFVDDSENKASCVFDVIIEDLVKPIFLYCPPGQNITTGQQMTMATWDEPIVEDIPGDDVLVTCNYETNQVELPWGENEIVYRATNLKNGFQNECKFTVNIEPVPCAELHTPMHGALSCDDWMFRRYCSVSCEDSYDIPRTSSIHQPTKLYVCGASGLWSPHAYVADCSETRDPRRSYLPSALQYYTGNCETPTTSDDIAQAFINILRGSMFRDACDQEADCLVENVVVWCGDDVAAQDMLQQNQKVTRRRKRQTNRAINNNLEVLPQIKPGHGNTTIIYLDLAVMIKSGKAEFSGLDHEDLLLSMAHGVKEEFSVLYNLTSLSMMSGSSHIQCEDGYIADHDSFKCVACTTGHFYDGSVSECIPCFHGYYQDKQAQVKCKKCPVGRSTETKGSQSIDHCKDMCPKGHFSSTGLLPCIKCPRDTFQPMAGQTSCFDCTNGAITEHTGATSQDQCIHGKKTNL
ncbi:sushi, von Willebrand factor type A, EGF and pentraxin domain-containing protein 1-like [Lytechinus variegatus]|uniref:sushi, von Willebrand factor type A, EGF and pentraxin domain-containing protein 1-like n=1 Tax=Lytechinus variegatus TaxID=7654 RepID=UPI001BB2B271|nr:sushi, von Willebrand factor type A, EGF and pentraxin domain-containing protein 1-like [Lytechinus variegatus]